MDRHRSIKEDRMAMEASGRRTRQRTSRPGAGSVGWGRLSITDLGRTVLLGIFDPERLVAEDRRLAAAPVRRHNFPQSAHIPH